MEKNPVGRQGRTESMCRQELVQGVLLGAGLGQRPGDGAREGLRKEDERIVVMLGSWTRVAEMIKRMPTFRDVDSQLGANGGEESEGSFSRRRQGCWLRGIRMSEIPENVIDMGTLRVKVRGTWRGWQARPATVYQDPPSLTSLRQKRDRDPGPRAKTPPTVFFHHGPKESSISCENVLAAVPL